MEIFHTHYKLNRDESARTGPLLRWLGGSIIAHALLIAAMVYVPAVRDTFALASTLSAFEIVSEDYKKTEVHERATIINLAANQLYYPYDLQNPPVPDPALVETVAPTPMPIVRQPRQRRPRAVPTPSPTASPEVAENAGDPAASPSPGATPEPQSAEEAEQLAKKAGAEKLPQINDRPFKDLLKKGKEMRDKGEINLNGTVELTVEAERQEDGTLNPIVVTDVGAASDENLKTLAKEFAAALGDSKVLAIFKGAKHIVMKVKLDDKEINVRVTTELPTAGDASGMANGYSFLLWAAKQKKAGRVEEQIISSVKLTSEARQVILTFNMPRKDASELLSNLLKKDETPAPTPAT